jgi:two-component system, OmpR family, copper resistance phosphate regulon response regulator CusR
MTPPLICVIEDEEVIAAAVAARLRADGFAVEVAHDGEAGVALCERLRPDLVVLDLMLPGLDGLEVCRRVQRDRAVPVLMLTARGGLDQRVEGLDAGADDYLSKPYHFPELLARVRALLRRGPAFEPAELSVDDLVVDTRARTVTRAGSPLQLTTKEYALLEYLLRRKAQVVSRGEIAEHVWDYSFDPMSNLIEVYIQRLRRKIDDGRAVKLIHTRRGAGYTLSAEPIDLDA